MSYRYGATITEAVPGNPKGPEVARGCEKCKFGIISQPDIWHCGVPPFIARAMARQIGGQCYVVYCNCTAGKRANEHDAKRRKEIEEIHGTITVMSKGQREWATGVPNDYIPGEWWKKVKVACEQA